MDRGLRRSADATAELVRALRTGLPALAGLVPLAAVLALLPIALPSLPSAVKPLRALASAERRRAGRVLGREIPEPYPPSRGEGLAEARRLLRSPSTWRDVAWLALHGVTALGTAMIAVGIWPSIPFTLSLPLWWWAAPEGSQSAFITLDSWPKALTMPFLQGAFDLAILLWVVPRLVRWQARLAEALLSPTRRTSLAERVEELTETRAEALEAHGAELRRIERDLHDGTQAQLVAAALRLGLADRRFDGDPEAARALFLEAREGIEEALTQLRTVIRGIYPPILSDRGLAGALRALAAGQPIPVEMDVEGGRAPAAVEAAAYFVVAEALTNIAKHSGARHGRVAVRRETGRLTISVRDDGKGGADPDRGSGLAGIRRRVAALDGTTRLDSPDGEGTTLEVELPCGS
ncbi:sensor domain-containing protein [Actinomadura madurae]|uniref:sensor histidine kinase n=1 Tax=Actinomadura madurae TaxID=1993 RepID=UPI002025D4D3|nr:sensor domain-containing protein [Actinomadura madurae]URN01391.1 sensor domain-containing protein [Actinomadura madurae]URN03505.1 sensor domain-containing protein [Actinomadura madurae]